VADKKKITVTDITWFYAAPTPSGFASNGIVLTPGDTREAVRGSDGIVIHELYTYAKNGAKLVVPRTWLWREEFTREVEVKD
jgi:hypothetical protein